MMFRRITPYLLGVIGLATIGDLIFLNIVVFRQKPILATPLTPVAQTQTRSPIELTPPQSQTCTPSCQEEIVRAVKSIQLPESSILPLPTPSPKPSVKEFYIPLGTGYTQNNDWENAYAAESAIDTAVYGEIKEVYFEANLRLPVANGTVYARLYNVTDNHPVWNSEVSTSQGTSTHLISSAITLDAGNKLYRVQIKTSLQYPSYLDFSRVKIQTK